MSADTANAAVSSFALQAFREGETERGISALEQQVDGGILSYWGYLHIGDSEFDQSGVVAKSHKVMRRVAGYRMSHPPIANDPGVLDAIDEALAYVAEHR